MKFKPFFVFVLFAFLSLSFKGNAQSFVKRQGHQFVLNGKPYYYIGTNYWYGGLLGLIKDKAKGVARLQKELDFLKSKGVINLRVVAGAEGKGIVNGVERIGPPLQTEKGVFNEQVLDGLDLFLSELAKRDMKAILFLSNNWEWSGGFLQYLRWNNQITDSIFRNKMEWEEMRDQITKFYTCTPCKEDYLKQVDLLLNRTNKITKKKYSEEPAIMAWELANEPRPMRPAANEVYKQWISDVSTYIKSKDKNHLVTIGHEGDISLESNLSFFEEIHAFPNVDYLTIHIWPKNWGWFRQDSMKADFQQAVDKTTSYINKHISAAQKLNKPLVIEEFGLPRDQQSFDPKTMTTLRDQYYKTILTIWQKSKNTSGVIAGANFWAFGGMARPKPGQIFWKVGDDYMGDPPMEEQGLNTVFDSDKTTWQLIQSYSQSKQVNKK
jgi:mannan endo-1,4-beta-mannosidase